MNRELKRQREYWNREMTVFDSIYSRHKGTFGRWLDATFRKDMFERFEYTMTHAEPITGRDFLDVGCGTGRYAIELARRGGRHVTGIDISEDMISHCRRSAAETAFAEKTEFLCSDLLEYTPTRIFDAVIGVGLFDYIRDPLPVLAKMRECAGHAAIMSFPRLGTWRAPVRKVRLGLRGCRVYFYSKKRIDALILAAGFKAYSLEKVGKLFCVTASSR